MCAISMANFLPTGKHRMTNCLRSVKYSLTNDSGWSKSEMCRTGSSLLLFKTKYFTPLAHFSSVELTQVLRLVSVYSGNNIKLSKKNYRSINVLNVFSKVFERYILNHYHSLIKFNPNISCL